MTEALCWYVHRARRLGVRGNRLDDEPCGAAHGGVAGDDPLTFSVSFVEYHQALPIADCRTAGGGTLLGLASLFLAVLVDYRVCSVSLDGTSASAGATAEPSEHYCGMVMEPANDSFAHIIFLRRAQCCRRAAALQAQQPPPRQPPPAGGARAVALLSGSNISHQSLIKPPPATVEGGAAAASAAWLRSVGRRCLLRSHKQLHQELRPVRARRDLHTKHESRAETDASAHHRRPGGEPTRARLRMPLCFARLPADRLRQLHQQVRPLHRRRRVLRHRRRDAHQRLRPRLPRLGVLLREPHDVLRARRERVPVLVHRGLAPLEGFPLGKGEVPEKPVQLGGREGGLCGGTSSGRVAL